MNKIFFAKLLSYIGSPLIFFLLMPYLIVYTQTRDSITAVKWSMFSAVFVGLGLLLVLIGKRRGKFSDLDLSNREERATFYLLLWPLLLAYLIASIVFRGVFFSLSIIAVGIVIGLLLFEVVNSRLKASIHMGVVTAFVLTIWVLFGLYHFLLFVWIIPLIGWSRIVLKRHTIQEVIAGCILGVIVTGVTFLIGKLFL